MVVPLLVRKVENSVGVVIILQHTEAAFDLTYDVLLLNTVEEDTRLLLPLIALASPLIVVI